MGKESAMNLTCGSVCAGVGGFDFGFERAGIETLWQVEIDNAANKILERRFPNAKRNVRDIRLATKENLEWVNILCGGTPCQGFSIAGERMSLEDTRSNLCFQFCRIADEFDPDLIVWENVPGVLSLEDNAFGCFLAELVGADTPLVPPRTILRWKKNSDGNDFFSWPDAGMVTGPKRTAAWRVLDSQYFGVAQRRERVIVVANPVARQRSVGIGEIQDDCSVLGLASKILFESESVRRSTPPSRETPEDCAGTITGGTHSGSNEACDKVAVFRKLNNAGYTEDDKAGALKVRDFKDAGDLIVAPTLKSEHDGGSDGAGGGAPIVAQAIGFDKSRGIVTGELAATLRCNGGKSDGVNDGKADNQCVGVMILGHSSSNGLGISESDLANTLEAVTCSNQAVATHDMIVRKLVPVECERLQGFPDDFTDGQSDSARYKQMGNAVTTKVSEGVGWRIQKYNHIFQLWKSK